MKNNIKNLAVVALAVAASLSAHAQFEKGKSYVGASLSGLDLNYNDANKGKIGVQAKGGYLFADDWMVTGQLAYDKQHNVAGNISVGAGARYYIVQNGLFIGTGIDFHHVGKQYNDFMPSVHLGYAFFLNRNVTIEPELYYNQSFKSHKDYSTIGFRVGLGVYL